MMAIAKYVRTALAPVLLLSIGTISGALAEEEPARKPVAKTAREEIKAFCANIADSARDQRYLLQKEELVKLQAQVDDRIAQLEKRRGEYEGWLKRRNDFLKKAGVKAIFGPGTNIPAAAQDILNLIRAARV